MGEPGDEENIHVRMKMYWKPLVFEIPGLTERRWYRAVDTSLLPPEDVTVAGSEVRVDAKCYPVQDRNAVVLVSK
jgi:glycogen operon protein